MSLDIESSSWAGKLEGPEEVISLFEVGSAGVNFIDNVFNANESLLSEPVFNDFVVSKWDSVSVDLSKASLVD